MKGMRTMLGLDCYYGVYENNLECDFGMRLSLWGV